MEDKLIKKGEEAVKRINGVNVVDERGYTVFTVTAEEYSNLKTETTILRAQVNSLTKEKTRLQEIVDTLVEKKLKEWEDLGIDIYRYVDI